MNIFITGGAGYIGAHTAKAAAMSGHQVTVFDNLSTGHRYAAEFGRFVEGDIRDIDHLSAVLLASRADVVLHFAALSSVSESFKHREMYFDVNVGGTRNLLTAMERCSCNRLVFSSSAAVYGQNETGVFTEDDGLAPISPYGETKLECEKAISDSVLKSDLGAISLRYFNAAGASNDGDIGEDHDPETHLIPKILKSVLEGESTVGVFGSDFSTPDGTAIRDYVSVGDLADAHLRAVHHTRSSEHLKLNLGTAKGASVSEVFDACEAVSGASIDRQLLPRRNGDPPKLVADNRLARRVLGWTPKDALRNIIEQAWQWHQRRVATKI